MIEPVRQPPNGPSAANDPCLAASAASAASAAVLVLDAEALANLNMLDPTGANRLLPRVLTTYRGSLARLLGQLTLARSQADTASVRLVTHTLKSSSASIGALALAALCGAAERAARDAEMDRLPGLLDQIEAEATRVDAAVLQLLIAP